MIFLISSPAKGFSRCSWVRKIASEPKECLHRRLSTSWISNHYNRHLHTCSLAATLEWSVTKDCDLKQLYNPLMLQLKVPVFNIYSPTKGQVCYGCGNQSNRWLKINVLTHLLLWEFMGLSFRDIRCPTDTKCLTPDTLTCKKLVSAMPCSRPRVQHKSNQLLALGRGRGYPHKNWVGVTVCGLRYSLPYLWLDF